MDRLDDFITGPQSDEQDFNEFDLDFVNDYYSSPSELFSSGLDEVEGTIEDIISTLDLNEPKEKEYYDTFTKVLKDPDKLVDIKNYCMDKIENDDTIYKYISDYTISDLGEMDSFWDLFSDIILNSVCEYFGY